MRLNTPATFSGSCPFHPPHTINARFANGSGSLFGVQTTDVGADSAIIGGSVDLSITETFGTYVSLEDELNSAYNTDTVFGGFRYSF